MAFLSKFSHSPKSINDKPFELSKSFNSFLVLLTRKEKSPSPLNILAELSESYVANISSLKREYNSSLVMFAQRLVIYVPFKHLSKNIVEGTDVGFEV